MIILAQKITVIQGRFRLIRIKQRAIPQYHRILLQLCTICFLIIHYACNIISLMRLPIAELSIYKYNNNVFVIS